MKPHIQRQLELKPFETFSQRATIGEKLDLTTGRTPELAEPQSVGLDSKGLK